MPLYGMASFAFVVRFRAIREPPHFCRMRAKPTPLYFRGIFHGRFSSRRKMGGLHLHPPIDHSGRQRRPRKRYKHLIFSIFRWVAQYLQSIIMGCNRKKALRTAVLQTVASLMSTQWYRMKENHSGLSMNKYFKKT